MSKIQAICIKAKLQSNCKHALQVWEVQKDNWSQSLFLLTIEYSKCLFIYVLLDLVIEDYFYNFETLKILHLYVAS